MRLRNRFALFFVTFAMAISAFQGWLSYNASRVALEAELDRKLVDVAGVVAIALLDQEILKEVGPSDTEAPQYYQNLLLRLRHAGHTDRADIFRWRPADSTATVVVSTLPRDSLAFGQQLAWAEIERSTIAEAYERGSATSEHPYPSEDRIFKRGIVRLRMDRGGIPVSGEAAAATNRPDDSELFLGILMPADYLERLSTLGWAVVALTAAAGLLAALIGWRLAGGIASRLEILSRGALRIQRGAMDRPFDLEGEDEIGRLARAMDRMRTGIRHRDEQLRLMLSRVAHEIRNPLGGLELFAAAAQETEDSAERRRILDRVRQEVVGLNEIIDEFLGFARPGRTEPQLHDIRESVGEAAALAEAELEKKGGTLHVDFPRKPLLGVADPLQIKRLVLNLLRNASQAGDRVWLAGAMVNGEVRVSVRDNGPGIPPELRGRIFEPFVGNKAKGAGLGLAIVKEMVESNHGRVELVAGAEHEDGRMEGAEFHVYLSGPEDLPGDLARLAGTQEEEAT